jgi:hypothetical protein
LEKIQATAVKYIKLGEGGECERECLISGIIRFGYDKTPHQMCLEGKWEEVNKVWLEERKNNDHVEELNKQVAGNNDASPG